MSRAARLLDLVQCLRRHRHPVAGQVLAGELGISLRTLYRDIATLQGQGAAIEGEPGVGYVLKPGFLLPPLMLTDEEIEALVLGARFVEKRGDGALSAAAGNAVAKIAAVLPDDLRATIAATPLIVGPGARQREDRTDLGRVRRALREERKLAIDYRDREAKASRRTIWPLALAFFDDTRLIVAWCELRGDFRSFRLDQMADVQVLDERFPRRRAVLLKEWRAREGIREPGV